MGAEAMVGHISVVALLLLSSTHAIRVEDPFSLSDGGDAISQLMKELPQGVMKEANRLTDTPTEPSLDDVPRGVMKEANELTTPHGSQDPILGDSAIPGERSKAFKDAEKKASKPIEKKARKRRSPRLKLVHVSPPTSAVL